MELNFNKERIINFIERGKRFDGRGLLEFRKIEVEEGIVKKAEGSARVKIGNTDVIAGVKINVAEPYTDSPDEGTLKVGLELTPLSSPEFNPGPPNERAIEMARVVDRGIRESEMIHVKKLCIKKGEKVWSIFVDIYILNDDGNLLDASALAAVLALKNARLPKLEDDKVLFGELTDKKLPLKKEFPITLTFYKMGKKLILDPCLEEEKAAAARLSVALTFQNSQPRIHALQKGGDATFTIEEIDKIISTAIEKANELKMALKI